MNLWSQSSLFNGRIPFSGHCSFIPDNCPSRLGQLHGSRCTLPLICKQTIGLKCGNRLYAATAFRLIFPVRNGNGNRRGVSPLLCIELFRSFECNFEADEWVLRTAISGRLRNYNLFVFGAHFGDLQFLNYTRDKADSNSYFYEDRT